MSEPKETDNLVYKGNKVPGIIKIVWIALIIFCVVYLAKYMLPDLSEWYSKWTG